ncbi:hypothetical protein RIF29_28677 [Crotalaria pallida]|uniref:F-box domain-containing protein n=1 Tax=Crotalaria pallida TaxID=3830 RepID=A0AAN9EIC9_CROPI
MWSKLPFDILANIFSLLSPDSLARARSTCKNWHTCVKSYPLIPTSSSTQSWFLALPIHIHHRPCCYVHNPVMGNWHELNMEFLPIPSVRPIASIGGLILLRVTNSTMFQIALCNPFTMEFRYLPRLNISRTNPAVGVVTILESNKDVQFQFQNFRIYVAGGMSEAEQGGGATYEATTEVYDSRLESWQIVGSMPVEFSVRLTVWTPNENVYVDETLYWITSARVYSVMGFEIGTNKWREISVPMAERLEFASLVRWNGALALVGGTCGDGVCIWEMNEGGKWCIVDKVPDELGLRLLSGKRNWDSVKCVGHDDAICLYRDLVSGMVICKNVCGKGTWEWLWVDGCGCIKGKQVHNCTIRGTLVYPTLASFLIF